MYHEAFFLFCPYTDNPFSFVEYKALSVFNPIAWYFRREVEISKFCRLQFSWFSLLDSSPSSSSCSFHELLSLHLGQRALKCCCSSSLQSRFIYRSSSVSYGQTKPASNAIWRLQECSWPGDAKRPSTAPGSSETISYFWLLHLSALCSMAHIRSH